MENEKEIAEAVAAVRGLTVDQLRQEVVAGVAYPEVEWRHFIQRSRTALIGVPLTRRAFASRN